VLSVFVSEAYQEIQIEGEGKLSGKPWWFSRILKQSFQEIDASQGRKKNV